MMSSKVPERTVGGTLMTRQKLAVFVHAPKYFHGKVSFFTSESVNSGELPSSRLLGTT